MIFPFQEEIFHLEPGKVESGKGKCSYDPKLNSVSALISEYHLGLVTQGRRHGYSQAQRSPQQWQCHPIWILHLLSPVSLYGLLAARDLYSWQMLVAESIYHLPLKKKSRRSGQVSSPSCLYFPQRAAQSDQPNRYYLLRNFPLLGGDGHSNMCLLICEYLTGELVASNQNT